MPGSVAYRTVHAKGVESPRPPPLLIIMSKRGRRGPGRGGVQRAAVKHVAVGGATRASSSPARAHSDSAHAVEPVAEAEVESDGPPQGGGTRTAAAVPLIGPGPAPARVVAAARGGSAAAQPGQRAAAKEKVSKLANAIQFLSQECILTLVASDYRPGGN